MKCIGVQPHPAERNSGDSTQRLRRGQWWSATAEPSHGAGGEEGAGGGREAFRVCACVCIRLCVWFTMCTVSMTRCDCGEACEEVHAVLCLGKGLMCLK
eukprot:1161722-Pelagomonas_calceolata.AAC.1